MTASETVAVFRHALDDELGLAMAGCQDIDTAQIDRTSVVFSALYRIAEHLESNNIEAPAELLQANTSDLSAEDRRAVVKLITQYGPHYERDRTALGLLEDMGLPLTRRILGDAGVQLMKGRAEAQDRMLLRNHPEVRSRADPVAALLDDALVRRLRTGATEPSARATERAGSEALPFLTRDTRRFTDIIDATIASIQATKDWNEDIAQRRRAIWAFAWATGNKQLCDYGPGDADHYATTLRKLPAGFRWGTLDKGNMSRPFDEVMAEIAVSDGPARNDRTINRDLTTLSRFGRELIKTAWKPRYGKEPVVNFSEFASASPIDDPDDPDRMPWTEEHLRILFSSTIYTGGGSRAKRLKSAVRPRVWHDAAYWVPLLLAYGMLTREEACGVECEDFVFDVETPFVAIVENMTKSKDGHTPSGLKRISRRRMVPLHPELLRLNLRDYVEAVGAEGHKSVFPELYQGFVNGGGKRFYAAAGRYQLNAVDLVLALPRTTSGKRADLHSLRTTGASALEDSDTKQLVVDDIMGHAREGTGPRKYSKAWFMKGGAAIMAKRLAVIVDALPNVTAHLQPAPIRLLPLSERSRTGSASSRTSARQH